MGVSAEVTLKADMCDCSRSTQSDLLQFGDESTDCETRDKKVNHVPVLYGIYTDKPSPQFVDGWACSTWIRQKIITTNFIMQESFAVNSIATDTSEETCRQLVETGQCGKFPMTKVGKDKYAFASDPIELGSWNSVVTVTLINCEILKVNMSHACSDCPLFTPVGPVDLIKGFISRAHVTVVWDPKTPKQLQCAIRELSNGVSSAYLTTDSGLTTKRLIDDARQLDYHLHSQATKCPCGNCTEKYFSIKNNADWFVKLTTAGIPPNWHPEALNHRPPVPPRHFSKRQTRAEDEAQSVNDVQMRDSSQAGAADDTIANSPLPDVKMVDGSAEGGFILDAAHIQYELDRQNDVDNELVEAIRSLQCEERRRKHAVAIATAHVNQFLAARQLGLKNCAKLVAKGEYAFVELCEIKQVNFTTVFDLCGAALSYNNQSISLTGYELVPAVKCASAGGVVHVAGKVYRYEAEQWIEIKPKLVLPHEELQHLYTYEEDMSFTYKVKNTAVREETDFLTQYAEIAFDKFEEANSLIGLPVPNSLWSTYWKSTSYWDIVALALGATLLVIVSLFTCMCLARCGIFRCIESACTVCIACCVLKKKKRPMNAADGQVEMVPLRLP